MLYSLDPPPEGSSWPGSIWHLRKRPAPAAYGRSRPLYPGAQNILPSWPRPFVPTGVTSPLRPDRLLSHPRSGTARKDPKANAAMMALRSHHYENIDILQHPSEENLSQPCIAGPRVPRPDAAVPASPAVKSAQSRRLRAKRRESQTVSKSLTAGLHRRVEAASLDPTSLHSSPLTLDSLRRAHPLTEAIRRDRSKSKERISNHAPSFCWQ